MKHWKLKVYQNLRRSGRLCGTIKNAVSVREKRDSNKLESPPTLSSRFKNSARLIPLGEFGYKTESYLKIKSQNPRKKNWELPKAGLVSKLLTKDLGAYSGRCRYTHYVYCPLIQSYGRVLNGVLWAHLDGELLKLKAPRGWHWKCDSNEIAIAKNSNKDIDYHICASDISGNWKQRSKDLCSTALENYKKRSQTNVSHKKFLSLVNKAIKNRCYVRLNDSYNAGNCSVGTQGWCNYHKISGSCVPLRVLKSVILDTADPSFSRFKLVVLSAIKRHNNSLQLGYSTL